MIRNRVLVTKIGSDFVKNAGEFRLETREVSVPTCEAGESFHLVVALQVIHIVDGNAHAMGVAAAVYFTIISQCETHADRIYGDVFGGFDLLECLVERQLAESIDSC